MSCMESGKLFYINSKNRNTGVCENFTYTIQLYANDNFDRATVMQVEIPKSYYLIQANANTFTLTQGVTVTTITIPIGNYSRRSFQTTIQTLLNTAATGGRLFTVSWPAVSQPNTGKYTFSCTDVSGIEPILTFADSNVAECMGFNRNSTNQFSSFILESTNVINLQLENTLYLHSDLCSNGIDDVLQEIYCTNEPTNSFITWLNPDPDTYSKKLVTNAKNNYRFMLTDEFGKPMQLNGIDMQITLLLYKRSNADEAIKNYIKYRITKEEEQKK